MEKSQLERWPSWRRGLSGSDSFEGKYGRRSCCKAGAESGERSHMANLLNLKSLTKEKHDSPSLYPLKKPLLSSSFQNSYYDSLNMLLENLFPSHF